MAYPLFQRNRLFTNELEVFATIGMSDYERSEWIREHVWNIYQGSIAAESLDVLQVLLDGCDDFRSQVEATYEFLQQEADKGAELNKHTLRDKHYSVKTEVIHPIECSNVNMIWGDKHPLLVLDPRLEAIVRTWPVDARVIYMQRDGRDVVASHLRLRWINEDKIGELFDAWVQCYERIKVLSRVLFVRQESLLENPASVVKSLNRFLSGNVASETDYLSYIYKHDRNDEHQVKSMLDRRKHQGYWKKFFSPDKIPAEAKRVLQELGYS
jgi:hypothetical protein